MSIFQRIVFPFSNLGSVCHLYEYENTLVHKFLNEQILLQEVESLKLREISSLVFFGFLKDDKLEYYKKKLDFFGFRCLNISQFYFPNKKNLTLLSNTIRDIESLLQFVSTKNFALCFPNSKEYEVLEYIVCSMLYLDTEVNLEEILEYFLGNKELPFENLERLKFFQSALKNSYSPVLKKFILDSEHLETQETLPEKMKVGELELNLGSLNGKATQEIQDENFVQKLNLNSLTEDDTFENPLELLEEVLDFAESFEETLEEDEWKQAFPDTGKKIESNQTSKDELQAQKPTELVNAEDPLEDYTFSSLVDLDAITESYLALEEQTPTEKEPALEVSSDSTEPAQVENETLSENVTEDLVTESDVAIEIKLDFTSEKMETIQAEVELDSDPSFTSVDRQIKDALTKEVLIEEDDPRLKKEPPKKESKPKTIIVTPEKKEEKLSPLSKEKLESLKEEFNAIQLD